MRADLSRLNPQSFERLVRALALHIFGANGIVYSAGGDAGRDFTIEGSIKGYETVGWNGYLVLQSKFKETALGERDAEWLVKTLKEEQETFRNPTGRRKPDYYIVATNVSLSGADTITKAGKHRLGGLTKVNTQLKEWQSTIGIRDFDVWPADKIIDLLASAPSIRREFAAWVTSGDVLSSILDEWESKTADFGPVIKRALLNSIRQGQFTSLKDAGSVSDLKIRTGQVFIDIPYEAQESERGPAYQNARSQDMTLVKSLVERAKERLNPESVREHRSKYGKIPYRNRIVILGGPGQGKSTVASFTAQLFRSVIVADDPTAQHDDVAIDLVPEILLRARSEKISPHIPKRYPILVSLPRFADAITTARASKKQIPSLLSMISTTLSEVGDGALGKDDVREWLSRYPWIVVLDGLDEVPPSGERTPVLDAISGFLTEINEVDADVLTVVTTRPQGYNRDLDSTFWEHWELTELSTGRALAYATALGIARYPEDKPRRDDIMKKLSAAAEEAATARLMISPLQVTILYLIVDTGGSAPAARWTLFNEYYEVLRRREKAKGGELQAILERNWAFLGPIHQRAGLILQALSELGGSAQASFDRDGFERLVREYLSEHGFAASELEARSSELAGVALNRLVLLSAREEGSIRFDVRSLQEFMAAAALTSGEIAEVEARLLHLAGISHWRHTVLIGMSRCFAEDAFHHRRSAVVALARTLDISSPADSLVSNGARLALEMFIDGIGIDYPVFRRVLARHAIESVGACAIETQTQLVHLWEPAVSDIVMEGLRTYLHSQSSSHRKTAWQVLLALARRDPACLEIAKAEWPQARSPEQLSYFEGVQFIESGAFHDWLIARLKEFPASRVLRLVHQMDLRTGEKFSWRKSLFPNFSDRREQFFQVRLEGAPNISFGVLSITDKAYYKSLRKDAEEFSLFQGLAAVCDFGITPDAPRLAQALRVIGDDEPESWTDEFYFSSWPLGILLEDANRTQDMYAFADAAEGGDFGNTQDWLAAESRWKRQGITPKDLENSGGIPRLHKAIAERGAPALQLMTIQHDDQAHGTLNFLLSVIAGQEPNGGTRELAQIVSYLTYFIQSLSEEVDHVVLVQTLAKHRPRDLELNIVDLVWPSNGPGRALAIALSELAAENINDTGEGLSVVPQAILDAVSQFPEARGLLYLTVLAASAVEEETALAFDRVPSGLLFPQEQDCPHVAASAACLAAAAQGETDVCRGRLLEHTLELARTSETIFQQFVSAVCESRILSDSFLVCWLVEVIAALDSTEEFSSTVTKCQLKLVLDRRKSNILSPAIWLTKLRLPRDAIASVPSRVSTG